MKQVHFLDTMNGKNYLIYHNSTTETEYNVSRHKVVALVTMNSAVGYNKAYLSKSIHHHSKKDWGEQRWILMPVKAHEHIDTHVKIDIDMDQDIYELSDEEFYSMIAEII